MDGNAKLRELVAQHNVPDRASILHPLLDFLKLVRIAKTPTEQRHEFMTYQLQKTMAEFGWAYGKSDYGRSAQVIADALKHCFSLPYIEENTPLDVKLQELIAQHDAPDLALILYPLFNNLISTHTAYQDGPSTAEVLAEEMARVAATARHGSNDARQRGDEATATSQDVYARQAQVISDFLMYFIPIRNADEKMTLDALRDDVKKRGGSFKGRDEMYEERKRQERQSQLENPLGDRPGF